MSGRIAAYPLANLRAHTGALPLNELILYIVKYVAIEEMKVLLQHFLSVNPIFVVICGPKQPPQNCLSKASFMLCFLNQPSGSMHIFFSR
jgi:hypothetical protein